MEKLVNILKQVLFENDINTLDSLDIEHGEQVPDTDLIKLHQNYLQRVGKMDDKGTTNRSKMRANQKRAWDLTASEIVFPDPAVIETNADRKKAVYRVRRALKGFFQKALDPNIVSLYKYEPIDMDTVRRSIMSVRYVPQETKLTMTVPKDAWARIEKELRDEYPSEAKMKVFVGYEGGYEDRKQKNAASNARAPRRV